MNYDKKLRRYTLAITCGYSVVVHILFNAINLAIPNIGETYQAATSMLSWVVNSFVLVTAVFLLPFGRLADIIGRKKLFVSGLLILAISSFLCSLAWSIEWLILFRIIQGVGAALGFSTSIAILTSAFPADERGRVLGIYSAFLYLGLALGPTVGGFLIYNWGWTSVFVLCGVMKLILFVMAATQLKGERAGTPERVFDWKGSLVYIVGLGAFLYGISSLNDHAANTVVALGGLLLLVLFTRIESRVEHPMLPFSMLRHNRVFAFSSLITLINYAATFATMFLMSILLQSVLRLDSRIAGLVLLTQPIVMAVVSPFSGRLSDSIDPKKVSLLGLLICMLSLFLFAFVGLDTPMFLIVANLIIGGIGHGMFAPPNTNAVMGSVDKSQYGLASATLGSVRTIGQSISMALAALILGIYVGSVQLAFAPPDLLINAIRTAFVAFAVICFFGVLFAVMRVRTESRPG